MQGKKKETSERIWKETLYIQPLGNCVMCVFTSLYAPIAILRRCVYRHLSLMLSVSLLNLSIVPFLFPPSPSFSLSVPSFLVPTIVLFYALAVFSLLNHLATPSVLSIRAPHYQVPSSWRLAAGNPVPQRIFPTVLDGESYTQTETAGRRPDDRVGTLT